MTSHEIALPRIEYKKNPVSPKASFKGKTSESFREELISTQ